MTAVTIIDSTEVANLAVPPALLQLAPEFIDQLRRTKLALMGGLWVATTVPCRACGASTGANCDSPGEERCKLRCLDFDECIQFRLLNYAEESTQRLAILLTVKAERKVRDSVSTPYLRTLLVSCSTCGADVGMPCPSTGWCLDRGIAFGLYSALIDQAACTRLPWEEQV